MLHPLIFLINKHIVFILHYIHLSEFPTCNQKYLFAKNAFVENNTAAADWVTNYIEYYLTAFIFARTITVIFEDCCCRSKNNNNIMLTSNSFKQVFEHF